MRDDPETRRCVEAIARKLRLAYEPGERLDMARDGKLREALEGLRKRFPEVDFDDVLEHMIDEVHREAMPDDFRQVFDRVATDAGFARAQRAGERTSSSIAISDAMNELLARLGNRED